MSLDRKSQAFSTWKSTVLDDQFSICITAKHFKHTGYMIGSHLESLSSGNDPEWLLAGRVAEDNRPVLFRRGHMLARRHNCVGFVVKVRALAGKLGTSICTVLEREATDQCSLKDRRGFGRNGEAGEHFGTSITGGEMVHLRPFLLRQLRYSE